MSPYTKIFELAMSFTCIINDLHIKIIKQIQAMNNTNLILINLGIMIHLISNIIL